ncbi:ATP-binding protein, partial [Thermodesulfobacteriota bacterium]
LINSISELKYTESALKRLNESLNSYKLGHIIKKNEAQLKNLYQSLIDMKMQPFDVILEQLTRAINEYCLKTSKKIEFSANTNNIVIDSTVLKVLVSPLIHIIRNAIDHGIEPVDERLRQKKTDKGSVSLTVKKLNDFAEITVSDDGGGLPIPLIIKKALEKGYLKEHPAMIDNNLLLLILTSPGFTTKEQVSLVSGRGIGLDIVKSSLENIGGSLSLETESKKGTRIVLKVPVTTVVIKSMLVKAGTETVGIPSSSIEKIVLAKGDSFISDSNNVPVKFVYENNTIKLKSLASILYGTSLLHNVNMEKEEHNIILLDLNKELTAVIVDELVSEDDLFISPLTKPLKKMSTVLGYSILGSSAPVFLLDVDSL